MKNPQWLTNRAAELLEEYKKAQENLVISSAVPGSNYWKPPPQDVYKLNFDAAVFSDLNCSGVGAIIRNFASEVMAGWQQRENMCTIAMMQEHWHVEKPWNLLWRPDSQIW